MDAREAASSMDAHEVARDRNVSSSVSAWASTTAFGLSLVGATLLVSSAHLLVVGALAGPVLVLPVVGLMCLGAGLAARRGSRTGLGVALGVAILALLGNVGHLVDTLGLPASPWDFVPNLAAAIGLLIAIPAAIGALHRRPTSESIHHRLRLGAVAVVAVGALVSVGLSVIDDPTTPSEALVVTTVDNVYDPDVLEVSSGSVIGVRNLDAYGHTFTVVDLGIDVGVAGDAAATVELDASTPTGTYDVTCVLHPQIMVATLVVTDP